MGKMESLLAMLQHILHWRHIVSDGGYALVVSEVNVPCFTVTVFHHHDYTQSVGRIAALPVGRQSVEYGFCSSGKGVPRCRGS